MKSSLLSSFFEAPAHEFELPFALVIEANHRLEPLGSEMLFINSGSVCRVWLLVCSLIRQLSPRHRLSLAVKVHRLFAEFYISGVHGNNVCAALKLVRD